ncbi:MAG: FAD-dependent 5-carboxymethylaminomethyl-2-thiouridine(34) oxidoreductase MnmC [Rubrivivax sp.]|nr:FAD-dependent 5-carboxymethylaminomethyl-2-thiouridine(34) oxidoreductase MnmC [Rubrivivax sp.]
MKTEPITPATIGFDHADGVPHAPAFGDRYHPRAGALAQAAHVFLRGNGLPGRWAGRARFAILETGFGLGHNFLATWEAWRTDAARCARLHFVSVERHPPRRQDLVAAHRALPEPLAARARALHAAWPVLTGDLHRLAFEAGRVELLLAFGDAAGWLRRLQLQADAVFLDGFAPARNPAMWSPEVFSALPALCAPEATAATWSTARAVREGLATAGFEVHAASGFADKREMTLGRFAPRHRPAPPARRQAARPRADGALVIGAGLAGACAALALHEQGLEVQVLEAGASPAAGASGNPAGLVRGLVTRDDGAHARWHRAAALQAWQQLAPWVDAGRLPGRLDGVLHFGDDPVEMQRLAAAWPSNYVQSWSAAQAAQRAGIAGTRPAWWFPQGGWVDPAALVRLALDVSGARLRLHATVARVHCQGERWIALDAAGAALAEAEVVVLAGGASADTLAPAEAARAWGLGRSRGQLNIVGSAQLRAAGATVPHLPLAGAGYVIALPGGDVLCGATQAAGDDDPALRAADQAHNLEVFARLTGQAAVAAALGGATLPGRVAWRAQVADRLPLIGGVPAAAQPGISTPRLAQPRHVLREPGLFILGALGSRGITSALLGARVLAALVADAPLPVDTDLLDAIDAARHAARAARRPHRPA